MIHEQVQKQLNKLKASVDYEKKEEEMCKRNGWTYTPSRRKWEDINNYEAYKAEIEKNGDKNLLVMVKLNGDWVNMYGVYPFARRYVGESYLVHYCTDGTGTELLCKDYDVEIVNKE